MPWTAGQPWEVPGAVSPNASYRLPFSMPNTPAPGELVVDEGVDVEAQVVVAVVAVGADAAQLQHRGLVAEPNDEPRPR